MDKALNFVAVLSLHFSAEVLSSVEFN